MKRRLLLLFFSFLPFSERLACVEFYEPRRFYAIEKDFQVSDPGTSVSVGYLFLTRTVGFLPDKGSLSPGIRLSSRSDIYGRFTFGVLYTQWDGVNVFTLHNRDNYIDDRPRQIFHRPLEIKTSNLMKNVELQVGYGREGVMPYVGFEWCLEDTTVTINGETSVSDMKHLMGAQGGVRYEFPLFRYLVSQSGLSVSFLNARYQRSIDESRQHSDRFFLPRSKLMLGLLFSYPVKGDVGISLYGGYEMQYLWERGMDQKIQWEDPIALQGVNLNFSIRY